MDNTEARTHENRRKPPGITRCGNTEFRWGERTYVMGIVNVDPDSFSGDGIVDPAFALTQARQMVADGADILDVGGESTRPGAAPVSSDEEMRRIIPVIETLSAELTVPISVDTYKAEVASAALRAGAHMLNDIWGLKHSPGLAEVAARHGAPIILMQNQRGAPFKDVLPEMLRSLSHSMEVATNAGVARDSIILDPGIGFGKTPEQNLEILRRLDELKGLGRPILVGTSRKSLIGLVLGLPAADRLEGTAATVAVSIARGADIVRVHDVPQMVRVARMSDAIVRGWKRTGDGV